MTSYIVVFVFYFTDSCLSNWIVFLYFISKKKECFGFIKGSNFEVKGNLFKTIF